MHQDFKGMRPGQNKRGRGRNHNPNNMGGHNNNNNNNNRGPRPPNRMQTFDSNGPSVKIRGNAYQVFERYIALAREASSAGDRIAAENLYQHAEHYYRIMQANGDGQNMGRPPAMTPADTEMNGMDGDGEYGNGQNGQNGQQGQPQQGQPQASGQPQPNSEMPADEGDGPAA
jgi:hypothetical protein